MNWKLKKFDELTTSQLYTILKARVDVFVVEQQCPYPELDRFDEQALHLYLEEHDQIKAYARLLPKNSRYPEASIGRVLVVEQFRGKGYANMLMEKAVTFITTEWKEQKIKLQAQTYLQHFYESFGFKLITKPYVEDGIPHIDMILAKE